MQYMSNSSLPRGVQNHLPKQAQELYREAFNHAWEFYKDPHTKKCSRKRKERARSVAWCAVEDKYVKIDAGDWIER